MQARDQVFFNVRRPHALGHVFDLGRDLFDHLGQKGAGARCRVKHLNAVHLFFDDDRLALFVGLPCVPRDGDLGGIGQPFGKAEFAGQHLVDGPHDEIDDRFRGIPDAACFALGRVIGGKEGFVKMQKRVVLAGQPAKVLHDFANVSGAKHARQIVDDPLDPLVQIMPRDIAKQRAQERVGFGQEFQRLVPVEGIKGFVVQPRRKHPVGNGFRIDIGKISGGDIVDQMFFECVVLPRKVGLQVFIFGQGPLQNILDQKRLARHAFGKVFGRCNGLRALREKITQQVRERVEFRRLWLNAHYHVGNGDRCDQLPVAVEIPIQTIGVDQIGQTRLVSFLLVLVCILHRADADVQVFRFGMADHDVFALEREIGRANIGQPFRLILCGNLRINRFKQRLESGTIGMFCRIVVAECVLNRRDEICNDRQNVTPLFQHSSCTIAGRKGG